MNIKNNIKVAFMALTALIASGSLTSCSDEPDSEYFYAFTGEMMSDYLKNRAQYSEFAAIVDKAELMPLLSTYGKYTCFLPDNDAVDKYLQERGLKSVDELTKEDCDTIARTHLVNNIYSTFEMTQDRLPNANLLGRYIATSQGFDADSNAVVYLEGLTHILFEKTYADGSTVHQNDSVENGIVQPIDMVIEKSNSTVTDILRDNPRISLFYKAFEATGLKDYLSEKVADETWDPKKYPKYYYKSHVRNEVGWVPDTKKYGFTAFVEPDSIYREYFKNGYLMSHDGVMLYELTPTSTPATINTTMTSPFPTDTIVIAARGNMRYAPMVMGFEEGGEGRIDLTPGDNTMADGWIQGLSFASFDIAPVFCSAIGVLASVT